MGVIAVAVPVAAGDAVAAEVAVAEGDASTAGVCVAAAAEVAEADGVCGPGVVAPALCSVETQA